MKIKHLFFMLLALPMVFVACSETSDDATINPNAELTLTSDKVMQFTAEGGNGTITYTLENVKKGTLPKATTSASWITNITVGENITFTVEANDVSEVRSERIFVSYGDKNFNVFVEQEAAEYVEKFVADKVVGTYLGSTASATYNMNIYLTDLGFTDSGNAIGGATYYRLDLYSAAEPQLDAEGWLTIPAGTYYLDSSSSAADMTLGYSASAYFKLNEDASDYDARAYYDSAELVVTESGMTLTAYVTAVKHIATYNSNKFYVGIAE